MVQRFEGMIVSSDKVRFMFVCAQGTPYQVCTLPSSFYTVATAKKKTNKFIKLVKVFIPLGVYAVASNLSLCVGKSTIACVALLL